MVCSLSVGAGGVSFTGFACFGMSRDPQLASQHVLTMYDQCTLSLPRRTQACDAVPPKPACERSALRNFQVSLTKIKKEHTQLVNIFSISCQTRAALHAHRGLFRRQHRYQNNNHPPKKTERKNDENLTALRYTPNHLLNPRC